MKKLFQSKSVPRGTRTIWRYLGALFILFTFAIGNVWAQTSWVRLDSIDFTNTTNFPAATYLSSTADVKTTVNGVFFWAKKGSKALKVNDDVVGVDFGGQNVGSNGQHGVAIPVTGVNGSLKVIVYHDYNNTSANHKVGISHAEGNDPSVTQTFDQSPSNSGTKNKNEFIFTKTSLTGTDYIVWVGESSSSYTHFKKVAIYTEAPTCTNVAAPTGLSCTAHEENALTFEWTAAEHASSYDVKLWTNSGCTGDPVASANVTGTSKEFTGLTAATTYYCKVQSKGDGTTYCTEGGVTAAANGTTDNPSSPVDPTLTYNEGAYTIGATALDLSSLIDEKQSSGAITYSVKTDGGTSATIAGTNFTAEAVGTCVVTASQAEVSGIYSAKTVDFNVVVSAAPVPCATLTPATSGEAPAANDVITLQAGSTGGSIKALTANLSYTANGLQFGSSSSTKAEVTLNHLMQVGTVITATIYNDNNDKNRGLNLLNSSGTSKATWTKNMIGDHVETYTVVAGDGLAGSNVFQLQRNNNACLKSIAVSNCGDELFALSSAIDPAAAEDKASVALSKNLVAAGGTATATYTISDPTAYDFDEWVVSGATIDDAKANPVTITMGSTDAVITLKLKAAAVKHTVTYYDGATELGSELVVEGDHPTGAGLTPHKLGYTFGGWSTTDGEPAVALNTISVAANMPLYAVWSAIDCASKTGTIYTMEIAVAPAANCTIKTASGFEPTLDLYQYEGIVGGEAMIGNTGGSNNCILQTNKTILLKDDVSYLKLDFDCPLKEGDKIQSNVTGSGKAAYISTANTRPEESGALAIIANSATGEFIVPAASDLIDAQTIYCWKGGGNATITSINIVRPAKYAVTFNMHDHGTAPDAQSIVEGGKVTEPSPAPTAEGWSFGGWYKEDTYDNAWDFATDVVGTSAVELHAKWTAWPTMTLNRGAATSGDDVVTSVEPGSAVTVPACPFSYTDYNFNGWEYSPAVTMVDETHFTMPSENLTLTAQWVDANNVAQIGSTKYATFAEAAAAVADGETIQLLQDCDYDATWTITGMAVTLDLNGKNLTGPASGDAVAITTDGVLTIMDGTATVDPSINGSNEITYAAGKFTGEWLINVYAGGSFVMNSGWLLAGEAAAWVTNSGIVTVNNGVLEALTNAVVMGPGNAGKGGYTMNIHGGILLGHMSASGIANGYSSMAVYHPNTGTLNIDGGTLISENGPGVVVRGGASNITGGTIIAQGNGGGKCGDANAPLIGEVGVAYDFKANYPGVSSVAATISGTANVSGEDGAVQAIYAATEPTATEEAAVAISGGTFNTPVAEALCADDYYPATKPSGKYGVTYAAESIDFEAFIDENGTDDAAKTLLASQLAAKHYELSETLNTDHLDAPAGKPQDKGFKVKKTGLEIYFSVEPEKVLEIKTGNISGASIAINGGAAEDLTSTSIATHTYYNDNAQAVVLRMTKADNKYNIFQSINIRNPYKVTLDATTNGGEAVAPMYGKMSVILPSATKGSDHFIGWYDRAEEEGRVLVGLADAEYTPTADVTLYAHFAAQSNDGRLSDLQVDGTTVDGFDMDVHIYNLTVPYGTAVSALPKITLATAYDSYAQGVSIYPTDGPEWRADVDGGCYVQQANVTAEDGSVVYNQVRTKILPKDMACLIKATVTGDNAMAIDASASIYEGTESIYKVYGNAETYEAKSAPKFQSDGYLGVTLTTAGAVFQEGDVVRVFATKGIDNVAKLYVYSDNTGTAAKQIAESETALVKGYNEAALTAAGEGATSVFLCRAGQYTSWNPCIYDIAVYRPVPNPLVETITFNGAAGVIDNTASPKTITVEVPASTDIATMPVVATFYSNDPIQTSGAVTGGTWAEGTNEYIVTDKDGDQSVYTVTISKAAPSNDATLSSLTVNDIEIVEADKYVYNYELPYGTTDIPVVAAVKNHAGAEITTLEQATATNGTATVVVTAEDASIQTYTINFSVCRVPSLVIFDGSTMTDYAESGSDTETNFAWTVTGGNHSAKSSNVTLNGKTYTTGQNIFGSPTTSSTRYIEITIPEGYLAKFYLAGATNSGGNMRSSYISKEKTGTLDESIAYASTDQYAGAFMESDFQFPGTYYYCADASIRLYELSVKLYPIDKERTLTPGIMASVCLPNSGLMAGASIYEIAYFDEASKKIFFDEVEGGIMEAGMPYIVLANEGSTQFAVTYTGSEDAEAQTYHGLAGWLGAEKALAENEYFIYNNMYYYVTAADAASGRIRITAERAYIPSIDAIPGYGNPNYPSPAPAPGRRRVALDAQGSQVVTGIDNIDASETPMKVMINGQMFILRGEKMYDATGRLVK